MKPVMFVCSRVRSSQELVTVTTGAEKRGKHYERLTTVRSLTRETPTLLVVKMQ